LTDHGLDADWPSAAIALIERLLAGRAERTVRAYLTDLDDFARSLGRERNDAVTQLLSAGVEDAHELELKFAAHLEHQGRAPATIARRISTLRMLVRLAHPREAVEWCLDRNQWSAVTGSFAGEEGGKGAYVLPRHPAEVDRLDLQHHVFALASGGTHYRAPVERLQRVLDVGAGTGQWGRDICSTHPEALVVGFDLVEPKPGAPEGYRVVRGDVLNGLPFASHSFDLVHQRMLFTGVPVEAWPATVTDLVRVCRPGGWVELVEGATCFGSDGPALRRLVELLLELYGMSGLDTGSVVFASLDQYLVDAGLEHVTRWTLELPLGEWGGKVGSLMACDVRSLFTRLAVVFKRRLAVPMEECFELVRSAQLEWEERHTTYGVAVAWGRKPATEAGQWLVSN
jgi:SAM-dependent methyltransferase